MRKKVFGKKLNRNRKSRRILFLSLVKSMVLYGKITTTKARAKAVIPELDSLIGLVKDSSLASRRIALASLGNDRAVADELFARYSAMAHSRNSGYVSVSPAATRRGDNAEMVTLSWVQAPEPASKPNDKDKKDKTKKLPNKDKNKK